jgi:hypothetical protein
MRDNIIQCHIVSVWFLITKNRYHVSGKRGRLRPIPGKNGRSEKSNEEI